MERQGAGAEGADSLKCKWTYDGGCTICPLLAQRGSVVRQSQTVGHGKGQTYMQWHVDESSIFSCENGCVLNKQLDYQLVAKRYANTNLRCAKSRASFGNREHACWSYSVLAI
mmetsp:Transcript_8194/g.50929  ORF Transcript_8194/g.50929 Transcript_8194/m.50929 type:complete len:113 (+) Transcript_8194:6074-6412(+)